MTEVRYAMAPAYCACLVVEWLWLSTPPLTSREVMVVAVASSGNRVMNAVGSA